MPTKVFLNAGQITINVGATFLVTDAFGWIDDKLAQGFFVNDTRMISYYKLSSNRDRLLLLTFTPSNHHYLPRMCKAVPAYQKSAASRLDSKTCDALQLVPLAQPYRSLLLKE